MKTEPTEKEKLIERLEVEISDCQDDLDAASWAYEEGILISKREAAALLDLAQSSQKIKQLEWAEGFFALLSDTPFGIYQILKPAGTHSAHIIYLNDKPILIVSDLNEAKSAAQADFEKRVMECLDLQKIKL